MPKTPIKAICWDLDGTLIQFKINSIKARRKAINILKNHGISKDQLTPQVSILENVYKARDKFREFNYSEEKINQILKEVDQAVIKVEHEAARNATLIKGIDQVLEFVKLRSLKQAIFTYNTFENAKLSLETTKIFSFFDVIVGRDNVSNLKPHPDHLKLICNKLEVASEEILVIGDTGRDIEAAINVGAHSIGLNTKIPNFLKRESFKQAHHIIEPDEIPHQLIKAIEKLL